jgi:hypothetical protein
MSYRPFSRATVSRKRGRAGWPRLSGLAAVVGGLSAAVAFLAAAGPVQAARPMAGATAPVVGVAAGIPRGAARIGAEPGFRVLRIDVVLAPRDPAALSRYAIEVATPGSPLYHDYLPRGAFPAFFGPTAAAIATVRSALRAVGLRPGPLSANHLSIPVTATATAIERAFGTTLATYRLPGGRVGYANTSTPRLPAAAAAQVQAIFGLSNLVQMQPMLTKPGVFGHQKPSTARVLPDDNTGGPQPCTSALDAQAEIYSDSGDAAWVLTADQMAYEYEFSPLYKAGDFGQGQTIAVMEFGEPNLTSDIADYQACYGTHANVSYQNIDGFNQTGAGEGEAALDIETVTVMAPKANVIVYRGPNSEDGWYDTFATAALQDVARTESVSYGLCEPDFGAILGSGLASALNVVYEQQAVQGQTVVVAAGDSGSEGCLRVTPTKTSQLAVSFPSSDPYVLAVGGTSVVSPTPVQRQYEVVWNDGYDQGGAGGGGESVFFAEPSYQTAFGISISGGSRAVPDVSADADEETGYLTVHSGDWTQVGGTSAATPLWAALLALTDAKCPSSPVGFVNPAMYYAASPAVKAIVLNDIQADPSQYPDNVSNDYTGDGGGEYPVLVGYDMATGLGSPVGGALATQLCESSAQSEGYRLATADGQVYSFNAPNHGSLAGKRLASKVTGIADDPHSNGYWLVTAKGAVSAFDAPSHGSAKNPSSAVVGIASDNSGNGYWVVTAKGKVYAFNAPNHGSVRGSLASPVVGIAADPFTGGYWLVTAKGKVYAFDAGSYRGRSLSKVTGIAADPAHQGYWLVTATGAVYGFNVAALGSMPVGNEFGGTIGVAGDRASGGYWLSTGSGIVAGFAAAVHGSHPGQRSSDPIVGIAGTH